MAAIREPPLSSQSQAFVYPCVYALLRSLKGVKYDQAVVGLIRADRGIAACSRSPEAAEVQWCANLTLLLRYAVNLRDRHFKQIARLNSAGRRLPMTVSASGHRFVFALVRDKQDFVSQNESDVYLPAVSVDQTGRPLGYWPP